MATTMSSRKIILFTVIAVAAAACAYMAVNYLAPEKYDVEHVTVETKNLTFYSDNKPVNVITVDKQVPRKSHKKSDLASNQNVDVQVWIE